MTKVSSLSVFFPAYNEEKNIGKTIKLALKTLPNYADQFEIIVVNDGSTDKTAKIVTDIVGKNNKVRLISHKTNLGYGASLKTGIYSCQYPTICFTDSDGQFDISQINRFLEKIEDCDLVIGYRVLRKDKGLRLINAKAWGHLIKLLFGLKVKDVDCGFKIIKKRVINTIPKLESTGALISTELLVKAKKANFSICQVGVDHFPRTAGEPTGANIMVIAMAFLELLKLYPKLK